MGNHYSSKSMTNLLECDLRLQRVFAVVLKTFDHTILTGHRPEKEQNAKFFAVPQLSKVKWPDSSHNCKPSKGIDACPYPVDFDDSKRITYFAGFVIATALHLGIRLRWGGDWDSDTQLRDNSFDDLCHFEIIED